LSPWSHRITSTGPLSFVGSGANTAVIGNTGWPPIASTFRSISRYAVWSSPNNDSTGKVTPCLSLARFGVTDRLMPTPMASPWKGAMTERHGSAAGAALNPLLPQAVSAARVGCGAWFGRLLVTAHEGSPEKLADCQRPDNEQSQGEVNRHLRGK